MGSTAKVKKRTLEPQLLICSADNQPVDDVVKALIDEWLVPALVEEFIRLKQQGSIKRDHRWI